MPKITVLGDNSYKNWIGEALIKEIEETTGLIIFTGGPDVDPELYGEKNLHSYVDKDRSTHDVMMYQEALRKDIPKLGICYGSQFLTAMQPEGRVIQDVANHAIGGTHEINDRYNTSLYITSTHHQMMFPWNINNFELIAWSAKKRSTHYLTGGDPIDNRYLEPEIVYYPDTNCLAIQGHPEFNACPEETREYCRQLIKQYLLTN